MKNRVTVTLWAAGVVFTIIIGLVGIVYSGLKDDINQKASKESVEALGTQLHSMDKKLDILLGK